MDLHRFFPTEDTEKYSYEKGEKMATESTKSTARDSHEKAQKMATVSKENTERLHRRRLKNARQVRAESVLDTNPPQADKVSASSFWLCPSAGCCQPAVRS